MCDMGDHPPPPPTCPDSENLWRVCVTVPPPGNVQGWVLVNVQGGGGACQFFGGRMTSRGQCTRGLGNVQEGGPACQFFGGRMTSRGQCTYWILIQGWVGECPRRGVLVLADDVTRAISKGGCCLHTPLQVILYQGERASLPRCCRAKVCLKSQARTGGGQGGRTPPPRPPYILLPRATCTSFPQVQT